MLITRLGKNEAVKMDNGVKIVLLDVCGGFVRIGVEAPPAVSILREEAKNKQHRCDRD